MTKPCDAQTLLEDQVELLRECQRRLAKQVREHPHFHPDYATDARRMADSIATLSAEVRKTQAANKAAAGRMTLEERIKVIADFFATLPEAQKRTLLQSLTRAFNDGKAA